jgi:hypothetical protein
MITAEGKGKAATALAATAALVALTMLLPQTAWAQVEIQEHTPYESPQRFAGELRFGPYRPDVDRALSNAPGCTVGPYEAVFGTGNDLLVEGEFDWQALDFIVGTLAIGASVGIFHAKGKSLLPGGCVKSDDETNLWGMPFSLMAVVRFDILADRWSVPLVPFFKAGLTYHLWWASTADGRSSYTPESSNESETALGGTFGLKLGGGMMFRLDWLDRRAARTLDNEFGVNHTYLVFEYFWSWANDFNSYDAKNLDVMNWSGHSWTAGLAMEF